MPESRTAVIAAFAGNLALAMLKATAAFFTGSAAMLAETLHSIADTGNQGLLFLGMRLAKRPPDARHPFGHGRDVYFWAFVVSMMLFTIGGAFSIWEAVRHLLHPAEPGSLRWGFGVLAGSFVFELASFAVAYRTMTSARTGRPLREYWRDSRDPTILTVLVEDSAALVSLVLAAGGLTLSALTGDRVWDAIASGVIGLLLIAVALALALENYTLLLGEAAPPDVVRALREVISRDPEVTELRALRTMALGPREFLVVAEAVFTRSLVTSDVEAAVRRVETAAMRVLGAGARRAFIVIEPASPAQSMEGKRVA